MRVAVLLLLAGCATAPARAPGTTPFAEVYLARPDEPAPPAAAFAPQRPRPAPVRDPAQGLVVITDAHRSAAADDDALAVFASRAFSPGALAAVAVLRSPDVARAGAEVEAARTGYAQADDLRDLLELYRAYWRETRSRVGPRPMPLPHVAPDVETLSAEIAGLAVDIAFERLRGVVRDTVAAALRGHADAARLADARRVLAEDVELQEALVAVLRARFEAGETDQAALLAFEARLETLRTEHAILDRQDAAVRARLNRLLVRPDGAPVHLDLTASQPAAPPESDAVATALGARPEVRAAELQATRAGTAVRLAETMTLPRLDLGASRPEPVPRPMPRADFGVREAQVAEMRARAEAARRARDATRVETAAMVREALFGVEQAFARHRVHDREIVPRARRAFEAERGAYEGARTGYIELLDSARRLLQARLGRIEAARAHAHARARLIETMGVNR